MLEQVGRTTLVYVTYILTVSVSTRRVNEWCISVRRYDERLMKQILSWQAKKKSVTKDWEKGENKWMSVYRNEEGTYNNKENIRHLRRRRYIQYATQTRGIGYLKADTCGRINTDCV